jgi:hypothetical protein
MIATFNRFEIVMTKKQAEACSHPGPCDADVAELVKTPAIARQLRRLDTADIVAELREYGAWDAQELADGVANDARIVWIAAGNILDGKMNNIL